MPRLDVWPTSSFAEVLHSCAFSERAEAQRQAVAASFKEARRFDEDGHASLVQRRGKGSSRMTGAVHPARGRRWVARSWRKFTTSFLFEVDDDDATDAIRVVNAAWNAPSCRPCRRR